MQERFLRIGWARLALAVAFGMLAGCGESDAPDDELNPVQAPEIARIVAVSEAIDGAHIPTLDPATMVHAEIQKVLGVSPRCEFRYTSSGKPVLAVTAPSEGDVADGVVKLNGDLVVLSPTSADGALVLLADRVRLTLSPDRGELGSAGQQEADLLFEVGDSLKVGYRGYYSCVER